MTDKMPDWEPLPDGRPIMPYVLCAAAVGAVVTLAAVFLFHWLLASRSKVPPAVFHNRPLTIALSLRPGMMPGYDVSVNSAGSAEVTANVRLANPPREDVVLGVETLEGLRMTLKKEKFFDLPSEIGTSVVDGSAVELTVVLGSYSHTVSGQLSGQQTDELRRLQTICNSLVGAVEAQLQDAELRQRLFSL